MAHTLRRGLQDWTDIPADSSIPPDASAASGIYTTETVNVRFLQVRDIQQLLLLEDSKWESDQQADAATLAERIRRYPSLSIGAFCLRTGRCMASLFMKPTLDERLPFCPTWSDCARPLPDEDRIAGGALFGISLSSVDPKAAEAIFEFFWPHALKGGWRRIYLGSPIPGLRAWRIRHPRTPVETYARATRHGMPLDPQLRYYFKKGFRTIVTVRDDYFPHAESLDHGVLIMGRVPLSALCFLWRRLPLSVLQRLRGLLFLVL